MCKGRSFQDLRARKETARLLGLVMPLQWLSSSRSATQRRCLVCLKKFMLVRYVWPKLCKALYVSMRSLKSAGLGGNGAL